MVWFTLSLLQDASSLPSGDQATHHTRSVWPSSVAVSCSREDILAAAGAAQLQIQLDSSRTGVYCLLYNMILTPPAG